MCTILQLVTSLTRANIELIKEIALGSTNQQIGDNMNHTKSTIESYRSDLLPTINCKTALQVGIFAVVGNIITGDEAMAFWHKIEKGKIRNEFFR